MMTGKLFFLITLLVSIITISNCANANVLIVHYINATENQLKFTEMSCKHSRLTTHLHDIQPGEKVTAKFYEFQSMVSWPFPDCTIKFTNDADDSIAIEAMKYGDINNHSGVVITDGTHLTADAEVIRTDQWCDMTVCYYDPNIPGCIPKCHQFLSEIDVTITDK